MSAHPLQIIRESDETLFKAVGDSRELAFAEGEISGKHKLLIALAIDAAKDAESGIASLAKQALEAGATKGEIMETLRIAHYICGVGCVYTAARALEGVL